jgi:hypothetical protein
MARRSRRQVSRGRPGRRDGTDRRGSRCFPPVVIRDSRWSARLPRLAEADQGVSLVVAVADVCASLAQLTFTDDPLASTMLAEARHAAATGLLTPCMRHGGTFWLSGRNNGATARSSNSADHQATVVLPPSMATCMVAVREVQGRTRAWISSRSIRGPPQVHQMSIVRSCSEPRARATVRGRSRAALAIGGDLHAVERAGSDLPACTPPAAITADS